MAKKINPELVKVLSIWGNWRSGRVRGLGCLGYPRETAESRLLTSPGRSEGHNGGPSYFPSKTPKWVDRNLQQLKSRLFLFVWTEYVLEVSGRDPKEREARKMKILGCDYREHLKIGMEKAHREAADLLNMRHMIS